MVDGQIILSLYADFASKCGAELQAAGYTVPSSSDEEVIRAYENVRQRRVPPRPRKVHKAPYAVPAHLVSGERIFLAKVEAGEDLRPYQSTRLESADFNDGMLNDFGIQHFHLGTVLHPTKPLFMARTEPVLFALVTDNDFYSLGCYKHGDWTEKTLLDIIHEEWPEVISTFSLGKIKLEHNPTAAELGQLRKAGINPLTQRPDGTVHVGPGGGVAIDGKSAHASRNLAHIRRLCNKIEREMRDQIRKMLESGQLAPPVVLNLNHRSDGTFVVIAGTQKEFNLNRRLSVPPL